MTVLDACAVVAWLADEEPADEVERLLASTCVVSAVQVGEVVDQLGRRHHRTANDVVRDLLAVETLSIVDVDGALGARAGNLRAVHYHRVTSPVSMADCVAAATALSRDAPLATSDPALATMVWAEGGEVTALADSSGRRPERLAGP